ncbi:hypothetical protein FHS43_003579 [Streptosporangium becharense]|uniref:Uncharacterized protein n=1 Tax=Streptosporangium becharense TaxID=1816182 RepID=A0A7W9MFT5_9ACTN|nr:hypothetical protein [Streptosporangium becharense]MBB5818846.1 hypothetical protein [Streptosporangium becharense]
MFSLHPGTPYTPWHDPREATRSLRYALHRHGFTHTYQSNGNGISVLSVLTDLTVWCRNGLFVWNEGGHESSHPADDPAGAARLIAEHRRPAPGHDPAQAADPRIHASAVTDSARG